MGCLLFVLAGPGHSPGATAEGAVSVSAGGHHTCLLTTVGGVECWGANDGGQLGDGSTTRSLVPVPVSGLSSGVTAIATGTNFTCALVSGAVKCWGSNEYGQLGIGSTTDSSKPVDVSDLASDVTGISAEGSGLHACAVLSNGGVMCWGANQAGQLGTGDNSGPETCVGRGGDATLSCSSRPVDVTGLPSATTVAAGATHTCAISGGEVECWGEGLDGELGDGAITGSGVPVSVTGLSGVTAISLGRGLSCALTGGGAVYCWGYDRQGQLGTGSSTAPEQCVYDPCSTTPIAVPTLPSGVERITAGGFSVCAVAGAGGEKCWGDNSDGELGIGNSTGPDTCGFFRCSLNPIDVPGLGSGVSAVSSGAVHSCAVREQGLVACWGFNDEGQVGKGELGPRVCVVVLCDPTPGFVVGFGGAAPVSPGDANCDGRVNVGDILATLGGAAGTHSPRCPQNADVDCDGSTTAFDALLIARYVTGLLATFSCAQ